MGDIDYQAMEFAYEKRAEQDAGAPARHPVVVVGAGPVGLTTALDLARRGLRVVVLDDDYRLSTGSRAICFSKRTLEIWDRLGVGQRMTDKGVSWNVGKVFFREQEVWRFDLLPEPGHRRPAFINLQQYYAEGFLYEQARAEPNIDLRWKNKVAGLEQDADGVAVSIETPEGPYTLRADWLIACDGARSPVRKLIGQESHGRIFRDRFLIADVKMKADFPAERWFWFDPPFHPNQSVLLHMQPDNVWRIDFQLGWNADPVEAVKPENVLPRIRALLGPDTQFDLEWVSVYTFACERMDAFRHGRVVFAGDSAHRVSPFGARGANSGVQDAENLAWKLAGDRRPGARNADRHLQRRARARRRREHPELVPSHRFHHAQERDQPQLPQRGAEPGQDPSLRALAGQQRPPVAARDLRRFAAEHAGHGGFSGRMRPGAVALDAPVRAGGEPGWWLSQLDGDFVLALFCPDQLPDAATLRALAALRLAPVPVKTVLVAGPDCDAAGAPADITVVSDADGLLAARYDARPGTAYLIRPDQHIAARWRAFDGAAVAAALNRAIGRV